MADYSTPPTKILISIIIFVSMMGGFILVIQGMNEHYSSTLPLDELNSSFSRFGSLNSSVQTLEDDTTTSIRTSESLSLVGLIVEGLGGMWNTLKTTLGATPQIATDVSEILNLPSWFFGLITIIISVILIAAIIKVIVGRDM